MKDLVAVRAYNYKLNDCELEGFMVVDNDDNHYPFGEPGDVEIKKGEPMSGYCAYSIEWLVDIDPDSIKEIEL